MNPLLGVWIGIAVTFAARGWDIEWHAANGAHSGIVPPHLLLALGYAVMAIAAARGRRGAAGRERTYLSAIALAAGVAAVGQIADQLMHLLAIEGVGIALAHLASTFGFLVAAFVAVVATVAAARSGAGEAAS
ncbi:hypothetical protein [Natronoarchaeum mannanilyticum]|uniref:Uncharacterized protein n=1 Tax=Natronoarchaeum mannanilyticum TaxID=926360 RepID=A0AAV3TD78_9EURY